MDVQNFELSFKLKGKLFKGRASKFQVAKLPQIRVAVDVTEKVSEAYVFYTDAGKLFWFPLPGVREEMANAIARKIKSLKTIEGLLN